MGCSLVGEQGRPAGRAVAEPPAGVPLPAGTGCTPRGRLLPAALPAACRCGSAAPTAGLGAHWAYCHPLLGRYFSKRGCKSQSLLFQHMRVCSLLVKRVQRTESVFTAVAGELCSPVACRCSNLQPPEGKRSVCKPECESCCSPRARSTLPVRMWTALLLAGELKN